MEELWHHSYARENVKQATLHELKSARVEHPPIASTDAHSERQLQGPMRSSDFTLP